MSSIAVFDRTVQKTNDWLNDLVAFNPGYDQEKAYLALRATLHTLRDRLTPEEAAQLGAQLPMLIRGLYYEGWRPTGKPLKERHKEEFLGHIEEKLDRFEFGWPEDVVRSVFQVLSNRISEGEMEDVRQILPKDIRELFN